MKRFRVLGFDFDSRVLSLTTDIQDHWEEQVKELNLQNRVNTERGLILEFGELGAGQKKQNFIDLGPKPFSILAFHNRFFQQIRIAFVMSAYYPALTAACALGERILNYLVIGLRDDFKDRQEYKQVYNKSSFDNWDLAINTLEAWDVLSPDVVKDFGRLRDRRNDALHFRPEVDKNDRVLALDAIKTLSTIISNQFGAFGSHPWFITGIPGEIYIKKAWEQRPFIRMVYLPNCTALGPRHKVESVMPWVLKDDTVYDEREVTDEEFCALRQATQRT